MNMHLFLIASLTFISAVLLTPFTKYISLKNDILDKPAKRKVHRKSIPTLGGVAIFIGFSIGLLASSYFLPGRQNRITYIIIAGFFIAAIGIWDDIRNMPALIKLAGQILVATALYIWGFRIEEIAGISGQEISLAWGSYFITVFWIVGVINAINLIDGLDGLAAGIGAIVAIFLFISSYLDGNIMLCFITAALAASCLGFLPYNFYPASIFMGDTGSMLIGMVLAISAIESYQKSTTFIAILVPIMAMALPLIDTGLSIIRRFLKRKPLFKADKEHIHHRLMMEEKSQIKAVVILYLVTFFFGLIALGLRDIEGIYAIIALVVVALVTFRWLKNAGFLHS